MSLSKKIIKSLTKAKEYNSAIMVKPEVILWPDPECQWESVILELQKEFEALLVLGEFNPEAKQGPAIWIKCMVNKALPEATWSTDETPIIYLPGISKSDLKNSADDNLALQPLLEYLYTGNIWTQENGKEWTLLAFLQNKQAGLGIKTAQDTPTKDALKKALPSIFNEEHALYNKPVIDADYLHSILFPDVVPNIVKWLNEGDTFLNGLPKDKLEIFSNICQSQYGFKPEKISLIAAAEKLGSQNNNWKQVWDYFANAPKKYPNIPTLLRSAKPAVFGLGLFDLPKESWPQINEEEEEKLRNGLKALCKDFPLEATLKLRSLESEHAQRREWLWADLGEAPLVQALEHLVYMAETSLEPIPAGSIEEIKHYYTDRGFRVDQGMRLALAKVKSEQDKEVIKAVINCVYKPWLENTTSKFQALVEKDSYIFTSQTAQGETEGFVLFVDAFRFELAKQYTDRLAKSNNYKVQLLPTWSAIPSVTPTAKPHVSPIALSLSPESHFNEFRPQTLAAKDLNTTVFRSALQEIGFNYIGNNVNISSESMQWREIGDIDTKGHDEQSGMVRRVDELFDQIDEVIETAVSKGITKIKIVTDHGWLLLPGGLPKESLHKDLAETRWGRCALIKEGAKTNLLHLPWRWNKQVHIAYAPGISFFIRINEEYAHGGISLHECLIPELLIETNAKTPANKGKIINFKWVNLNCKVEVKDEAEGYKIDVRTKPSDPSTSIAISRNRVVKDGKCSIMVDDAEEGNAAMIVLLDKNDNIIDKMPTQVGPEA
ncbi:BREX-1 system phosphatase PglZ type B [Rufibacter sp. XAAS-G3-1]|uniref:BREX-1 system phosphatase PglZ type B n=1 Tax=Rufibacter sp. XAAS-G3-1 TaxID=2729134 RepID=UPI0015E6712A|nr:BREX-1 system phosphatase PglZ type B [Rufibacter sp. XAAS-G3-1]